MLFNFHERPGLNNTQEGYHTAGTVYVLLRILRDFIYNSNPFCEPFRFDAKGIGSGDQVWSRRGCGPYLLFPLVNGGPGDAG